MSSKVLGDRALSALGFFVLQNSLTSPKTFLSPWASPDRFLRNMSQNRHPNRYQVRGNEFSVLAV